MGLTRLAIARPVVILMMVSAFLVLGLISYFRLPAELNPKVDFPRVTVRTTYSGTNPQEMETLITKPIEDAISGVSGVQEIDSHSEQGVSTVSIQFYFGTDLNTADADVIQKVDAIRKLLPIASDSPAVLKADTSGRPVMHIAMQSKLRPERELQSLATNIVQPALEQATDVGSVSIAQGALREILVSVPASRLAAYGITIPQLAQAISNANVNVASGFIQNGSQYYNVRLIGEFASVNEIRNLKLNFSGNSATGGSNVSAGGGAAVAATGTAAAGSAPANQVIALGDIATVLDTASEKTQDAFLNGVPSIGIDVLKTTDGNTLAAVSSVKAQIKKLGKILPPDISFTISTDQSENVHNNLNDVVVSLALGAMLAVLVVFIFLHNIRGTIIIAIAIPTSMIATFLPMYALGFTLNTLSLLGLSLAVGILVDDSIVVLENINRHLAMGEEPHVAAINGRSEIGYAAITLTCVDLVVFLPIAFMGGVIGEFFRSFGVTVAFATLFSLFVSFTLTPMLAARWYKKGERLEYERGFAGAFDRVFLRFENWYRRVLRGALTFAYTPKSERYVLANGSRRTQSSPLPARIWFGIWKWLLRGPVLILLAGNLLLVLIFGLLGRNLGFRFAPEQDQNQVSVQVQAPAGSSLAFTESITRQIENIIEKTPTLKGDTKFVSTTIGDAGPGQDATGTQYAHVDLTLYDRKTILDMFSHEHLRTRADVAVAAEIGKLTRNIVGARILPANVSGFGSGSPPLQVDLTGPDFNQLEAATQQVQKLVAATPGAYNVDNSYRNSQPEVEVRLDRIKAPEFGLSLQQVASALADSVAGNQSTQYRDPSDGQQYYIRVQLNDSDRNSPQTISNVIVGYQNGNPVHLGDVADVTVGTGPVKIDRLNRQRTIAV
ncbi:MAG: efflux RND transporter permease subunit, partial [Armatimonadota bacterium]|nr:efflux RND transporter permease subunit [Armatimonadota bacterium]